MPTRATWQASYRAYTPASRMIRLRPHILDPNPSQQRPTPSRFSRGRGGVKQRAKGLPGKTPALRRTLGEDLARTSGGQGSYLPLRDRRTHEPQQPPSPPLQAARPEGRPAQRGEALHTLRHTFATLWMESNEPAKVLQEILGHSRIDQTMNTYAHVIPHIQADSFRRFPGVFQAFFARISGQHHIMVKSAKEEPCHLQAGQDPSSFGPRLQRLKRRLASGGKMERRRPEEGQMSREDLRQPAPADHRYHLRGVAHARRIPSGLRHLRAAA